MGPSVLSESGGCVAVEPGGTGPGAGMKSNLWKCPECGHRFVTRNMWHSCSNYPLARHFEGRLPVVREIFDRFLEVIRECGPVTVIPQKTRIAIQAQVRFAGGMTRKRWFLAHLWLTRRVDHPKLTRVERFGPRSYGLRFRFDAPKDIDAPFRKLVCEAYAVGVREHLRSHR